MKKHELVKLLEDVGDDVELLIASDEEGNSFHLLEDVSKYKAYKEDHEIYLADKDDEDADLYEDVVVFWP